MSDGTIHLSQRSIAPTGIDANTSGLWVDSDGQIKVTQSSGSSAFLGGSQQQEVLYSETLSGTGIFDVDLSSAYNQSFDHLILRALLRGSVAAIVDEAYLFFNGDTTTTNYVFYMLYGGTAHNHQTSTTPKIGTCPAASSIANDYGIYTINLPNYSETSKNKILYSQSAARRDSGQLYITPSGVSWTNTAAINQITLQPDGYATDSFVAGSYLEIIGVKNL